MSNTLRLVRVSLSSTVRNHVGQYVYSLCDGNLGVTSTIDNDIFPMFSKFDVAV